MKEKWTEAERQQIREIAEYRLVDIDRAEQIYESRKAQILLLLSDTSFS